MIEHLLLAPPPTSSGSGVTPPHRAAWVRGPPAYAGVLDCAVLGGLFDEGGFGGCALRKGSLPCMGPQFPHPLRCCCPWTIREETGHTVARNHNFLAS